LFSSCFTRSSQNTSSSKHSNYLKFISIYICIFFLKTFLLNKLQLKFEDLPIDENLARWHPDFDLLNIPDIDISPLPESPDTKLLASPIEIRHYAERTQSQRVKRALFSTFSSDDVSSTITLSSPKKETLSINGISSSLIEKVGIRFFVRINTNVF